jgi:hypothetical protein
MKGGGGWWKWVSDGLFCGGAAGLWGVILPALLPNRF